MLNSKALTKIQSIVLIAVVVVAAVGAGIAYVLFRWEEPSSETIKIGVLSDLNGVSGKHVWQGVILAADEINAEGGILGRQVEVISGDRGDGRDMLVVSSALTRLITYDKVDFIIAQTGGGELGFMCQDIIAEHQKIMIDVSGNTDEFTQRVLDNYNEYKYYFRTIENASSSLRGITDGLMLMRENIGFNKIGYLGVDVGSTKGIMQRLDSFLPENGFDLVYKGAFQVGTFDFSSYFAAAEAAETEVLVTLIFGDEGIPFVKEYYDRQSPMFVYGGLISMANRPESWEWTEGKCNNVATAGQPIVAGYPITSKTLLTRDLYKDRWDADITGLGTKGYDALRFLLFDAIERAGTIEPDAVVEALEVTSIETSTARNWVFTSSHDVMIGENVHDPDADYQLLMIFQWQDGQLVPVYPEKMMEEAGATYTYPDWSGPWD
ncbi:MAG: ABC transporter substrate-binding protein [Candidatus Bathyarchaeota archaeon]|nr:ABC transporter substrate-binding protein [Candidatus Bathyarchaeota archaeon]